ncbi:glucan endo-1,3-beta-D-glucosidase OS=Streptomyces microflavus OX=1919 GN=Smic_44940 PE=3 SV=1 [Streptomyces microflavus]
MKQVNGKVSAGAATAFRLRVDAGTKVGLAPQVRVSYDLTGDGTFDRTETFRYFATDPVAGWEEYTQAVGAQATTGSLGELKNGTVRLEIWNALGNGTSQVQTGTDAAVLRIPYV